MDRRFRTIGITVAGLIIGTAMALLSGDGNAQNNCLPFQASVMSSVI